MRVANCKTVCREIDELNVGQDLSPSTSEHVQACEHCRAFYDNRFKLRSMLADLETIKAPPDFDFRVRARLANDTSGAQAGLFFGRRSFSIPVAALASLVLLLAIGLAFRSLLNAPNGATAVGSDAMPVEDKSIIVDKSSAPAEKQGLPESRKVAIDIGGQKTPKTPKLVVAPQRRIRASSTTVASQRSNDRLATREFSSLPASVVKQDQAIASLESPVFAVETSAEPLKLSLDYDTGVSRTISLPALSFGSQKALNGNAASPVKTSEKGVW